MDSMNQRTREMMEQDLGMSTFEWNSLDPEEQIEYIEAQTKAKLKFPKIIHPLMRPRGSVLLAQGRISTQEEIDKKLKKLDKRSKRLLRKK